MFRHSTLDRTAPDVASGCRRRILSPIAAPQIVGNHKLPRSAVAALFLAVALLPASRALAARYPYTAEVGTAKATVRSGPGTSFYPTSQLHRRERVDVYYETNDGWCAIRPPAGSYSWVDGRRLRAAQSSKVAEVTAATSSFIGSELSETRDAVAVRLKPGERVAVLGVERLGKQPWIMIEPPSGEFRWIETKALRAPSDAPPERAKNREHRDESDDADERVPPPRRPASDDANDDAIDAAGSDASPDGGAAQEPALLPAAAIEDVRELEVERGDVKPADHETDAGDAAPRVARANLRQGPRVIGKRTTSGAPAAERNEAAAASTKVRAAKPRAHDYWAQCVALELELSTMVARDPRTWRFDDIRRDAQTLYDQAHDADEQDAARHLLGKIAQFESARRERLDLDERIAKVKRSLDASAANATRPGVVRRGAAAGNVPVAAAGNAATTTVAAPQARPAATQAATASDGRYDASGRLVAVQSKRAGTPPFAIVDDRNQVQTFISPAPNVNLQPYTGRVVGINGVISPQVMPGHGHVVAQRVALLEGPVRR
jgi:uncharacterized protein YraI